jgi:signal transduction histidine kinase
MKTLRNSCAGTLSAPAAGAELESQIEEQSQRLLDELEIVLGVCLVMAAACAGLTVSATRRAFRRMEWQAAELQQVSWQMLQDQEVVARQVLHEMHDELGRVAHRAQKHAEADGRTRLERPRRMCRHSRRGAGQHPQLSQLLRPVILDDFGLDAGLRWLTERFADRTAGLT